MNKQKTSLAAMLLMAILLGYSFSYSASAQVGHVEDITYYSTTQDDSCHMNIYFPPGYADAADTNHYPVFYLMHGGGENYTYWINSGYADEQLDEYIADSTVVPMILVMPDGRNIDPTIYSNEFLNDIIPYVEANYRTINDKDHRGIGGLSFGGQQALVAGLLNYEMFGYMAILSSGYFGAPTGPNYANAEALLETEAEAIESSMRYIYFAQGGKSDLTYPVGMETLDLYREYGITVHYWEYIGGHQWTVWRQDFESFTPYLFRDSTTVYVSLAFQGGKIANSTVMTQRDSLAPAPPDPTRPGYTFTGWYNEPEYLTPFNFETDTIRKNRTIYADWSINSYTVTFNSNGGNYTPDPVVTEYNTRLDEPTQPVKDGYFFDGWYGDAEFNGEWLFNASKVTRDTTLYAKWSDVNAVPEDAQSNITIYPNPAQSHLYIENMPADALINIYSADGKILVHNMQMNMEESIDIASFPAGMYTLVVQTPDFSYHLRFTKE